VIVTVVTIPDELSSMIVEGENLRTRHERMQQTTSFAYLSFRYDRAGVC